MSSSFVLATLLASSLFAVCGRGVVVGTEPSGVAVGAELLDELEDDDEGCESLTGSGGIGSGAFGSMCRVVGLSSMRTCFRVAASSSCQWCPLASS